MMTADEERIFELLRDIYGWPDGGHWLFAPHPQLDGDRAISRIANGDSKSVLATLERLNDGVYL